MLGPDFRFLVSKKVDARIKKPASIIDAGGLTLAGLSLADL
jgi:hypothetical protein